MQGSACVHRCACSLSRTVVEAVAGALRTPSRLESKYLWLYFSIRVYSGAPAEQKCHLTHSCSRFPFRRPIAFFGKECQVAEESRFGVHYNHACHCFLCGFRLLSRSFFCFKYFLTSLDLLFVFSKSRT